MVWTEFQSKLCKQSIITPLIIIFKTALRTGVLPDAWKKGNIVPVHKKESKNLIKSYRQDQYRFCAASIS